MKAARALLEHCVDYAGIFPPAGLSLEDAVQNYARYRAGADAWALGRIVLSAKAVGEFARQWPEFATAWPISVVAGPEYEREVGEAIRYGMRADVVECRPARIEQIAEIRKRIPGETTVFIEVPQGVEMQVALDAIASAGAWAEASNRRCYA